MNRLLEQSFRKDAQDITARVHPRLQGNLFHSFAQAHDSAVAVLLLAIALSPLLD